MNLCELRNVALERKARDYTYRLRIESLAIRAGEKIGADRPSGCGKSTALDLLAMILPPSAAEKFLFNAPGDTPEDVAELWRRGGRERMARLRLRHIGYVLQTGGLLPFLSARDNMTTPGRAKGMDAKAVDAGLKELGRTPRHRTPAQRPAGQTVHRGTAAGRHSAGAAARNLSSCSPTSPPPRWTP